MHWVKLSEDRWINLAEVISVREENDRLTLRFGFASGHVPWSQVITDQRDVLKIKLEIGKSIDLRRKGYGDGKH